MLIVISAVASAVALLGALLVGYSTHNTIAHMVPTRDPNSVLTAFPADVDAQIKQQSMVSTGVAAMQPLPAQQTPEQIASSLRDSLGRASAALGQAQPVDPKQMQQLAGKLESLLLDDGSQPQDVQALKDYALRELSAQDGSIALPNYKVDDVDLDSLGLSGDLIARVADLQSKLNEQIAALPELQGKQIDLKDVQLGGDPQQLAAAIDALGKQSDMLGLDFSSDSRYDTLQDLGEDLLQNKDGSPANLDGLDMNELESISREILAQLGQSGGGNQTGSSADQAAQGGTEAGTD